MGQRILVVDDNADIRRLVSLYLQNAGFEVDGAGTAEEALDVAEAAHRDGRSYALFILDVMLPGMDGFDAARRLRRLTDAPILFLSARDEDVDKATGLNLGGDDYITKPFSALELVARVRAHLRRYEAGRPDEAEAILRAGPLTMDLRARRVEVEGRTVHLTAREFDLLRALMSEPGRAFTKLQLCEAAWGGPHLADDHTVTVHMHRLRQKIEPDPAQPQWLETVWGIGYRLRLPSPETPRPRTGRTEGP